MDEVVFLQVRHAVGDLCCHVQQNGRRYFQLVALSQEMQQIAFRDVFGDQIERWLLDAHAFSND